MLPSFFKKTTKLTNQITGEEIEILNEVSSSALSTIDLGVLLQNSIDKVVSVYNFLGGILLLKENDHIYAKTIAGGRITSKFLELIGKPIDTLKIKLDAKYSNKIVDSVLDKEVKFSFDLQDFTKEVFSDSLASKAKRITNTKAAIAIPLKYRDEVIGSLFFSKSREENFERELPILRMISNQLAIAIVNARLFKKTHGQITQLEEQNQDLYSLFNLTSSITQSLDPERVAQIAVDSLPQNDEMLGGLISLLNEDKSKLEVRAVSQNVISEQVKKLVGSFSKFQLDLEQEESKHNSSSFVINNAEPYYTNSLKDSISPPVPENLVNNIQKIVKVSAVAEFPLLSRGEVIGTITYFLKDKQIEDLDDNRKQLFNTYSLQIGFALENALLFHQSQRIQNNLKEALAELQEARRRERDMIDVMGHELRTPISIVRNAILVLKDLHDKGQELSEDKLDRYLNMAAESVRREITLIETMLAATKIEGNRIQLNLTKVDLKDVVNDSIEAHKEGADRKRLQLIYQPGEGEYFAYADRVRTQEIMDNLLSNAIKYTAKGNVTISLREEGNMWRVDVKDTGVGISEDDLKKLGKKFFRAQQMMSSATDVHPGGTGLGLYVTFELINVMNGKKWIESKQGEGSTFSFALPKFAGQEDKEIDQTFMDNTAQEL